LAFNSEGEDYDLDCAGIDDVKPMRIDERNTSYLTPEYNLNKDVPVHGLPFIQSLIQKYKESISNPTPYGISIRKRSNEEPYVTLLTNERDEMLSLMQYTQHTEWSQSQRAHVTTSLTPNFLVLPPIPGKYARITVEILSQLPQWRPELFPKSENFEWASDSKYWSPAMVEESKNRQRLKEEYENKINESETKFASHASDDLFMKQILIADDGDEYPENENLTSSCCEALEFLGFRVENKEKSTEKGKRREDIICQDGDYVALVECKGTISENPPEKYHSQLLNHLLASEDIKKGLLVINHDRKNDAFSRLPLYDDAPHIIDESPNTGIFSTVELFKIVRAVQTDEITKDDARELIKAPGRIEYQNKN
jgi:hypothetical protein